MSVVFIFMKEHILSKICPLNKVLQIGEREIPVLLTGIGSWLRRISGSHNGGYEEYSLLGYKAV
jgi:hypothetical protein